MDKNNKRAEVIVADDQLSLAIGKHGQNVRLASKLVGWELDVRTKATAEAKQAEEKKEEEKAEAEKAAKIVSIQDLPGVGEKTLVNLKKAGFNSLEDIAKAEVKSLKEIKGIGEKKAESLIEEAKKLLA